MGYIFIVLFILFGISGTLHDSLDDQINNIFKQKDQVNPSTTAGGFCDHNKICVPQHLCNNVTATVITDGKGIISVRSDGNDCPYPEVCCNISDQVITPIIDEVAEVEHTGCGYRNPTGIGFQIVDKNENESEFGEFPWMVAILEEVKVLKQNFSAYVCGGAIIAPNVAITAAHCIGNRTKDVLTVHAGDWDSQAASEILPHIDRRVKEVIKNEKFNRFHYFNDVAILILEECFPLQENIRPICLPNSKTLNIDTEHCYATGWGKDKFGEKGVYQSILKKIDLALVSHQKCQADLRKTSLGDDFILDRSFICAGGVREIDTCTGDGGSPLVCRILGAKDRYYLVGLVAWGMECGKENVPAVYANVKYLLDWLNNKLIVKGIDQSFFTV